MNICVKIFIVQEGCQYEGTGIVSLHLKEEDAVKKAESIVANSTFRNYKRGEPGGGKEIHLWNDGTDVLIIEERETE